LVCLGTSRFQGRTGCADPRVAEGIETEAQARKLAELGYPRGQGYHFSRPVPAAELPVVASA
jgi:EAL domain-containing protein (putative c-di-GMP-specific phosphodiesterase class I)